MDNRIEILKWIKCALVEKCATLPDSSMCESISRLLNSEWADGRSKYEWYDGMALNECANNTDMMEMRGYIWICNGKMQHKTELHISIKCLSAQGFGCSLEYMLPVMNRTGIIYIGAVQQVDSAEASTIAVPPSIPSGSPR